MQTLNFIHLLHRGDKYKFSYAQLGKALGVDKMTIYRRLNASQISPAQEFRIKKAFALRLSELQRNFLDSYVKKS